MKRKKFLYKPITTKYSSLRAEIMAFTKYISKKLKLQIKTYYIACVILDKVLIHNSDLKPPITAISCILLASKFNELNICLTDMCEFEFKGKRYLFTVEQLKEYEIICMNAINFNLVITTAYDFIKFLLSTGAIFSSDKIKIKSEERTSTEEDSKNSIN